MTTHSKLPPSSSSRWSVCTASVGFIERNKSVLPPDGSTFADEGVKAHALAAEVLTGKARLVGSTEPDMLLNVRAYIEFARGQVQEGDTVSVEHRVSLFYLPSQWGTIDYRLVGKKRIAIIDYKHGAGVSVYAKENKQLAIYGESVVREIELAQDVPDDFPIELHIFQPRDRNDPEPVRSWTLTRKELRAFTDPIAVVAGRILADPNGGEFVPNHDVQCRFCPAKGICKAFAAEGLSVVSLASVDEAIKGPIYLPDPAALTRAQRVKTLQAKETFEQWLNAVEEQEMNELLKGAPAMGFKLVEGKSNRKWSDETAAVILLSSKAPLDVVAPRSPLSVAQAEKHFKKDKEFLTEMDALIVKPPGKPTLAPESDKRPALQLNPADGLENIDLV